jgi:hypothetical protein
MVVKTVSFQMAKVLVFLFLSFIATDSLGFHEKAKPLDKNEAVDCKVSSFLCTKTITLAFDPMGQLWRVWSYQQRVYFSQSNDNGKTFNAPRMIPSINEKVSARGENRIKLGFDKMSNRDKQGVYLSWASPKSKRFTADVRFSYSGDGGESFSQPITINDDNLLAGHSFNEMHVADNGEVSIVWLDGRKKVLERAAGKQPTEPGSSLYLAKANPRQGDLSFVNQSLESNTCQCCRIAITKNNKGELAILWRQIYQKNTREFALLTMNGDKQTKRVSFDEWKIDGCPHQGGALSIDSENRYHMVWFNQGGKGKGIFYSRTDDEGNTLQKPKPIGDFSMQSVHPHLIHSNNRVDIVWMQSNENKTQLWHLRSDDRGVTFGEAQVIAESEVSGDRPFLISQGTEVIVSWLQPNNKHVIRAL